MKTNDYVIINNRAYDPVTGLPVDDVFVAQPKERITNVPAVAQSSPRGISVPKMHRQTQASQTLSRRYVKKPTVIQTLAQQTDSQPIVAAYSPMSLNRFTVQKSAPVTKFSPATNTTSSLAANDRPAQVHPMIHRPTGRSLDITAPRRRRAANASKLDKRAKLAATQPSAKTQAQKNLKSAHVLKNEAIYEAMNREVAQTNGKKRNRVKKQRSSGRWARFMTTASASLAIVMLAGYFTYLNMPNLSVRMAAIQSGVDAKYPGYSPDGYALNGPVSFKDGEVSMRFAYADGERGFTLTQQKSGWDSSAVREFVSSQSLDAATAQVDGLTIYTYGNRAAWVNAGVLYTLEGNAPLSSSQIQRIATSL